MDVFFDPDRPKNYKYQGRNRSLADRFVLKHWWPIAMKAIPARMPANAVSMTGNLGSYFAFLIVSGILFGPVPEAGRAKPWIFALVAVSLFFYQTLDALDGIQARRTGASGPLGEFVDHWFDSFNVFLVPLGVFLAFPAIPWQLLVPCLLIFTATNWILIRSLNETGVLVFDEFSSEEGQLISQFFYLSVWLLGYDFWTIPRALGVPLILPAIVLFALGMVATAVRSYPSARGGAQLAAALASLLPIGAWIYIAYPRIGSAALLIGGLSLGFSGSRYVGHLMQVRLIGRKYETLLADIPVAGALVCAVSVLPVPASAIRAAGLCYLLWTLAALGAQFRTTLLRIRGLLGRGLFWPLTGEIPHIG